MNKIIQEQLNKVEQADLSNFDAKTNTYHIPQKKTIKVEEDKCYLIKLKESLFLNDTLKINWNAGSLPTDTYLKIDVSKIMAKMIKVVGVAYDFENQQDLSRFWSGWLTLEDIEVLERL